MKVLSVICARAGSKGLENKCIARVKDKMAVEYSIEYSLSLGRNVKTVVSTDIADVIDYCRKNSVDYIKRGKRLCDDKIRIYPVLADAIEKKGKGYKYCSLVYGNIPIRHREIFQKAFRFLEGHKDYNAVISMQNVEKFHPEWMLDYNEKILPRLKESHYRRQALPQKMIHDGHTVIFRAREFCERIKGNVPYEEGYTFSIFGGKIKPLVHDKLVIDIDTAKDLELAKAVIENSAKIDNRSGAPAR
ncbi:cytidylyltransferase domain-containing protein [Candidatus Omnitrophota bacterium]